MMRLALDGTPLLGFRSGIGEVVAGIALELARRPDVELVAYALTLRGRNELAASLPPGTRSATRPYPARLVRQAWLHSEIPGIERWTGPVDVVHGTNYVAPPTKAGEVVSVYDLGFLRYPEFVAADALDYPELLRRAIRRGAWIHTTSDFVRDEVVACKALKNIELFLTHEAPRPFFPAGRRIDAGKTALNDVLASMKPRLHLFGHHHEFTDTIRQGVRSIGLDVVTKSYLLVDADSFKCERLDT